MSDKYNLFRQAIIDSLKNIEAPLYSDIFKIFNSEISQLYENGIMAFENDYTLTSFALECRIKNIFQDLDFTIIRGRDGMEDFIVKCPKDFKPNKPLVIEVKSSRKSNISRDELRQLDDWVFELSNEHRARKYGLGGGGGIDYMAVVSHGMLSRSSQPTHHPTPHKGVFIFNGPIGTTFNERNHTCLSPNDNEFVNKRDFCVLPFDILINCFKKLKNEPDKIQNFWKTIHNTSGLFDSSEILIA